MAKLGICFPTKDFEMMEFINFKEYLLEFKKVGITSFDFYTSLFLKLTDKLEMLISFLKENNIKITFHYYNDNPDFVINPDEYDKVLEIYKKDLLIISNNIKKLGIDYRIPIVFHALNYVNASIKYQHESKIIKVFNELCAYAEKLDFDILIETLSYNHPKGLHIGDDLSELKVLANNINKDNFGICWDIGHTRLNNIEKGGLLFLPPNLMNKVKFTHIHNIILDQDKNYLDHLPLTNMDHQEELKYLVENKYQGIYSIEFETNNLKENILVYLNSVKLVKEILEKFKEEIK